MRSSSPWVRSSTVALAALALTSTALMAPTEAASAPDTSSTSVAKSAKPNKSKNKPQKLAKKLVRKSDGADAFRHLRAFQRIANRNDGNRASGTPGYDASVDYVARKLRRAGYKVRTPEFSYDERIAPDGTLEVGDLTFALGLLQESISAPAEGVTADLAIVPEDDTTGCEATDFDGGDYDGKIAIIRRGACTFQLKSTNAADAGAVAVIIANSATGSDMLNSTLGESVSVPVGYVSFDDGNALAPLAGQEATAKPSVESLTTTTRNVIAQTRKGRTDNIVMSGAHLDSVPVGPGINDNGSGSAGQLEVALELGGRANVKNAVRFAWWGAEELGLLGAEAYVDALSPRQQLNIALYLNFDMIGSPNAAYFVYDGDDSDAEGAGPGPYGSAQIEKLLSRFLEKKRGVPTRGTDFSGRSDYGPFIEVGIPAGGLFTGAEGIKTEEEAALWGGEAGAAYDSCYHAECDNLGNINNRAFGRNIDTIAWSVGIYAISTKAVTRGPGDRSNRSARTAQRSAPEAFGITS